MRSLYLLKIVLKDVSSSKWTFCLGFLTIFFVTFIITILMSASSLTPFIFFSMAELQAGQTDMIVSAGSYSPQSLVNFTAAALLVDPSTALMSPRFTLSASLYKAVDCLGFNSASPLNMSALYTGSASSASNRNYCKNLGTQSCLGRLCSFPIGATLIAIDSDRELAMGLGRDWKLEKLAKNQIYLSHRVATQLGVDVGDYVIVGIPGSKLEDMFSYFPTANTTTWDDRFYASFQIKDLLADNLGKLSTNTNAVAFIEYRHLLASLSASLHPFYNTTESALKSWNLSMDLYQNASEIFVNYPRDRIGLYASTDVSRLNDAIVLWGSEVLQNTGSSFLQSTFPILSQIQSSSYMTAFMNLIITVAVTIFVIISAFLLHGLLSVSVETKTFQYSMLRIMGETKAGIVQIIIVRTLLMGIPATGLGIGAAIGAYIGVKVLLAQLLKIPITSSITASAATVASVAGVAVPLLLGLYMAKRAFKFDMFAGKKTPALVDSSSPPLLPRWILYISLQSIGFGIVVCYMIVDSLSNFNFPLFLSVLFFVILAMLYGSIDIALNLLYAVQWLLTRAVFILLFFENSSLRIIALMNLSSHKKRNRQTAIMYATCVAFIVFMSVAIGIQLNSVVYSGTPIYLGVYNSNPSDMDLVKQELSANNLVEEFAWVSSSLYDGGTRIQLASLSGYLRQDAGVYTASSNFFSIVDPSFSVPDYGSHFPSMLDLQGTSKAIVSANWRRAMYGSPGERLQFAMEASYPGASSKYRKLFEAETFLSQGPVFRFSQQLTRAPVAIIDPLTYLQLRNSTNATSVDEIPISRFLIKFKNQITTGQIDSLASKLQAIVKYSSLQMTQYDGADIELIENVLQYIYQALVLVAMIICAFSLISSMYINVLEQKREIGILRSIGYTNFAIYRVFAYEALVLVLSSSLLGSLIGTLLGIALSALGSLFSEIPLMVAFPAVLLLTVLAASVVSAAVACFIPIKALVAGRPLASVLKSA